MVLLQIVRNIGARSERKVEKVLREVVPSDWYELVVKADGKGPARFDRVAYELCVLGALRDGLRSKEIRVVGADRRRGSAR